MQIFDIRILGLVLSSPGRGTQVPAFIISFFYIWAEGPSPEEFFPFSHTP